MEFGIIIIFAIVVIIFYLLQGQSHQTRIHAYIESLGGRVISIERRSMFSGLGPFMVVGKGRTVYRIEYSVLDEVKEGWVKFGGLLGPDWRLKT